MIGARQMGQLQGRIAAVQRMLGIDDGHRPVFPLAVGGGPVVRSSNVRRLHVDEPVARSAMVSSMSASPYSHTLARSSAMSMIGSAN
jgi:hypothetical protein